MTVIDLVNEQTPAAARLICAVAEDDEHESHSILNTLTRRQLMAVAVILAASVDPDRPLGEVGTDRAAGIVGRVVVEVALTTGVPSSEIYGRCRDRDVVDARHICFWVASALGLTSVQIGRAMGKDHSTILNGCARVTATPHLHQAARRLLKAETRRRKEAA